MAGSSGEEQEQWRSNKRSKAIDVRMSSNFMRCTDFHKKIFENRLTFSGADRLFLIVDFYLISGQYPEVSIQEDNCLSKESKRFKTWKCGEALQTIARNVRVADATVEIYVIDSIARGQGTVELQQRILDKLDVDEEKFHLVQECLTRSCVTLGEIQDLTSFRYNQIHAIIAVLINRFEM